MKTLIQQSLRLSLVARRKNLSDAAVFFLFLALLPLVFSAPAQAGRTFNLVDASGRHLTISLPVRRILVLNSDALEAVRILGAENLVVGVYDRVPEAPRFWGELANRPIVGSWWDPDCEAIAALRPDLVLAYSFTPGPQMNTKLGALGIKVLRLDFYKLAALEKDMALLGKVLGKTQKADQFIKWHKTNLGRLKRLIAKCGNRPRAYMEGYASMHAMGPGSSGYAMCPAAGGEPISSTLSIPYPEISTEWLLRENPQVIVKVSSLINSYDSQGPEGLRQIWQELVSRTCWHDLAAVRNNRVYVLAQDIWVGPGMLIGLAYLAKWFHPRICRDLKPRWLHHEFLERFQGLPLRGHFIYPDED